MRDPTLKMLLTTSNGLLLMLTLAGSAGSDSSGFETIVLGQDFTPIRMNNPGFSSGSLGRGVIVGGQDTNGAVAWIGGRLVSLHALLADDPTQSNRFSTVTGVGNGIVGYKTRGVVAKKTGFWYRNGQMIDFAKIRELEDTVADAVSNQGKVAIRFGSGSRLSSLRSALFDGDRDLSNGPWVPVPKLAGSRTTVSRVLSDGLGNHLYFVGEAKDGNRKGQAVFGDAREGRLEALPGDRDANRCFATDVNSRFEVVGTCLGGDKGGYLWPPSREGIVLDDRLELAAINYSTDVEGLDITNIGVIASGSNLIRVGRPGEYFPQFRATTARAVLPVPPRGVPESRSVVGVAAINDSGVIAGTFRFFNGKEIETYGALWVPKSNDASPPSAPAGTSATSIEASRHALVRWQDASVNELWFEIERRSFGDGPDSHPSDHRPEWRYWGAVPANAVEFRDTSNVQFKTGRIEYRVRAVHFHRVSNYSPVATVSYDNFRFLGSDNRTLDRQTADYRGASEIAR